MRASIRLRPVSIEVETGRKDALYRAAVRKRLAALQEENRRLRHGMQPRELSQYVRLVERLALRWIERRYPIPEGKLPEGGIYVDGED